MESHFVDIVIEIDTSNVVGGTFNRESIGIICNVTKVDVLDDHLESLQQLTLGCAQLRVSEARGDARAKSSDVGTMLDIGTRIPYEKKNGDLGVPSVAPYAANGYHPEAIQCKLVVDLAILGSHCFPQIYSVIRNIKGNSCLLPVSPTDGEALPTESEELGWERQTTGEAETCEVDVALREGAAGNVGYGSELGIALLETALGQGECRRLVGYTVNMSVDLGNLPHFDVHNASQGFAVLTEEVPDCGKNRCIVLPTVHGLNPDGVTKFRGIAVKLGHGVAISWEGWVIRHCTWHLCPIQMGWSMRGLAKRRTPTSATISLEYSPLQRREFFQQEGPKLQQVAT
jgi:hypothetical protein